MCITALKESVVLHWPRGHPEPNVGTRQLIEWFPQNTNNQCGFTTRKSSPHGILPESPGVPDDWYTLEACLEVPCGRCRNPQSTPNRPKVPVLALIPRWDSPTSCWQSSYAATIGPGIHDCGHFEACLSCFGMNLACRCFVVKPWCSCVHSFHSIVAGTKMIPKTHRYEVVLL